MREGVTILFTYAGMAAVAWQGHRHRWPAPILRAAGRSAWCAAWLYASVDAVLRASSGAWPWVDLRAAMLPGVWLAAIALSRDCLGRLVSWGGIVALVPVLAMAHGGARAAAFVAALVVGALMARAMRTRTHLFFRIIAHWLSFAGTFALLIPLAISQLGVAHRSDWSAAPASVLLVVFLAGAAFPLAIAGTLALFAAGGTPEPLDPPSGLTTAGIYVYLQHPIQIAEVLIITAGALLCCTPLTVCYAGGFTLLLVGPLRWWEERQLAARFGDAYLVYRARVPRYFPAVRTSPIMDCPVR